MKPSKTLHHRLNPPCPLNYTSLMFSLDSKPPHLNHASYTYFYIYINLHTHAYLCKTPPSQPALPLNSTSLNTSHLSYASYIHISSHIYLHGHICHRYIYISTKTPLATCLTSDLYQ